jgi:hypothetical protein
MEFADAQEMARKHPTSFEAPPDAVLDGINTGSHVKVCMGSERFWVEVTEVDGDTLKARIDNNLLFTHEHGLQCNDLVEFEKRHVYQEYDHFFGEDA